MEFAKMLQRHFNEKKKLLEEENALRAELADRHLKERVSLDPSDGQIEYHRLVAVQILEIKDFYKARKLRHVEMQLRQDMEMRELFR